MSGTRPDTALPTAGQVDALGEGERVLWAARPRAADETRPDATIWALPIVWSAFVTLIGAIGTYVFVQEHGMGALRDWRGGVPAPFTMTPMLLIGVWLLGRPWWARFRATRALYVLTTRRLLRFDGDATLPSESIALRDLGPMDADEGPDGHGALHVHRRALPNGKGRSIVYWRLRGIPRAVELRRLIAAQIAPEDPAPNPQEGPSS